MQLAVQNLRIYVPVYPYLPPDYSRLPYLSWFPFFSLRHRSRHCHRHPRPTRFPCRALFRAFPAFQLSRSGRFMPFAAPFAATPRARCTRCTSSTYRSETPKLLAHHPRRAQAGLAVPCLLHIGGSCPTALRPPACQYKHHGLSLAADDFQSLFSPSYLCRITVHSSAYS